MTFDPRTGELPPPPGPPAADGLWGAPAARAPGLHPRTLLLLVAGFCSVLLGALVFLLPVPYAVLSPGPVFNTLASYGGQQLITVEGRRTYPAQGQLDLTTVNVRGGPTGRVSLLDVVSGWLSPSRAVLPVDSVFPPGRTREEEQEENQAEMVSSQESATAAALSALDIPFTTALTIAGTSETAPANGVLRAGDVILAVDGRSVADLGALRAELQKVSPGDPTTVTVRRDGARTQVQVRTVRSDDGSTLLGVFIDPDFDFPFDVKITIDNVGGPSAGTMFALGIIDTLTPGDLTGGKRIAGTGTMDTDGAVGAIGGIQQKLVGARGAGAQWFLAPASNCGEVVGHVPDGLRVVRVETLEQARSAVEAIASDRGTDALPTCTAG